MSKDQTKLEDEVSDEISPDEPLEDDLFEDETVEDDPLLVEEDVVIEDDALAEGAVATDTDSEADVEPDADTEALDDLEAEELEMLTEDEASETIIVDEATQLRDIRRAQISIEASAVGGAGSDEFVCSVCYLVKKASQLSSRRKKVCLDCAG